MTDERGLIISAPVEISGTSFYLKSSTLDEQELRFSLLFWDKLNYPKNNIIHIESDQNCQFLEQAGILERTMVQVSGSGDGAQMFLGAYLHAFRMLDEKELGVWSLGAGENSVSFPQDELEEGRGVLVRLYQAIPVPDKEVPLQDILEFRTKRHAEFLALRHHLERIYQRVISAGDGELALQTEVETLDQAIADHIKISKESGLKFRCMSFGANLNLLAAGLAAKAAYDAGLGISGALLASGAALAIGPGVSLTRHKTTSTPFRYVSSFHNEVF